LIREWHLVTHWIWTGVQSFTLDMELVHAELASLQEGAERKGVSLIQDSAVTQGHLNCLPNPASHTQCPFSTEALFIV
jgi:hypothetical protein